MVLKLQFEVQGRYVDIKADITSKVPKIKRGSTNYFLTADGELTNEHPDQADMFEGPRAVRAAE